MSNDPIVHIRDLLKQFGPVTALDHVTFDVPQGTIFGFIGSGGCGKTTAVRCMIGNYWPTEGVVKVLGGTPDSFRLAERKQIGYMPQPFNIRSLPYWSASEQICASGCVPGAAVKIAAAR